MRRLAATASRLRNDAPNSKAKENIMMAVPMALISGVTPRRIEEKT